MITDTTIIHELYPDVVAAGGLPGLLQDTLSDIGSDLEVTDAGTFQSYFPAYSIVIQGARFSQLYMATEERLFLSDFWNRGVLLANGSTPDLEATAGAMDHWTTTLCRASELEERFEFVTPTEDAEIYEKGQEVEHSWQQYLSYVPKEFPELAEFVREAATHQELRQLFPYTSMNQFCFSRCTGYPYTYDTPHVVPLGNARFEVLLGDHRIGSGDAGEAVNLVKAHLPPGCGPAVPGTADEM